MGGLCMGGFLDWRLFNNRFSQQGQRLLPLGLVAARRAWPALVRRLRQEFPVPVVVQGQPGQGVNGMLCTSAKNRHEAEPP